jgi:hypothetical protein
MPAKNLQHPLASSTQGVLAKKLKYSPKGKAGTSACLFELKGYLLEYFKQMT